MPTADAVPDACRSVQLHIKNIGYLPCSDHRERDPPFTGTKLQTGATAITQPRQTLEERKCQQPSRVKHSFYILTYMSDYTI